MPLVLLCSIVLLSGCDDDEKKGGSVSINGNKYSLSHGYSIYDGSEIEGEDTYYNWVIFLTSDGLTFDESSDDLDGRGSLVIMQLTAINTESENLPKGTYLFPATGQQFQINDAQVYSLVDVAEEESTIEALGDVNGATVKVTKSGSTYTINVTITRDGEDDIKLNFTGKLNLIEA